MSGGTDGVLSALGQATHVHRSVHPVRPRPRSARGRLHLHRRVSRFGIGLESNGIPAAIYRTSGLDGVLIIKAAVIVGCIALMIVAARRFPRLLVWGGAAATSIGLLGFAANTASILILS